MRLLIKIKLINHGKTQAWKEIIINELSNSMIETAIVMECSDFFGKACSFLGSVAEQLLLIKSWIKKLG